MVIIIITVLLFVNNIFVIFILFMDFFERLSLLLKTKGISQKQLADSLGIRQATISDWKNKGNLPQGETAIKIADYFDISLDYLLTGNLKNELPDEDIALIVRYHNLSQEKKQVIKLLLDILSK